MDRKWVDDILDFWFHELTQQDWYSGAAEVDEKIRSRFQDLYHRLREELSVEEVNDPRTALAAVIAFDQFPRNMFRGDARSFATDHLALKIAKAAIDKGYDDRLPGEQRGFLYMPFQHSEDLDDQQRSVLLFIALGDPEMLHYARLHHDVIARFGRFPHRNATLGREPRPDEIAAGDVTPW